MGSPETSFHTDEERNVDNMNKKGTLSGVCSSGSKKSSGTNNQRTQMVRSIISASMLVKLSCGANPRSKLSHEALRMDNDRLCLRVSVFTSTVLPTASEIEATTRSNMIPNPLSELKASLTLASKKKARVTPPFAIRSI